MEGVLEAIVERIRSLRAMRNAPLQALIFDSCWPPSGIIAYFRVFKRYDPQGRHVSSSAHGVNA